MKRFTETQKWDDPWFRKLMPEMKLLWQWLLDRCDNAGVIDPDIDLASFQIGYQYPIDTLSGFDGRVVRLPCGKYLVLKFIEFQYGKISRDCRAHNPVFLSLEKHSLIEIGSNLIGYPYPMDTVQDKTRQDLIFSSLHSLGADLPTESRDPKRYASFEDVSKYANSQPMGITAECCEAFFDRMEEIGWVDDRGLALADWRARFRRYATNWTNNTNQSNRRAK